MIKESTRLGRAMFTLSFCFAYKSQSHNILFSTASCATRGPRLVDGVVIWHHKALLQRAVLHSNIYCPIKHRVIWLKRVPVFRCSPLTERCGIVENVTRPAILWKEFDNLPEVRCAVRWRDSDSEVSLTSQ